MNKFIITQDEEQKNELISCGFRLLKQSKGPQGPLHVFVNDKALFEKFSLKNKNIITTNTLTF